MTGNTRGAIAAGNARTAEAGIEMLRLGGNVFDAVVAAMVASFVAEPTLNSIAGGGFLLAHTHSNQNILFDFFAQTPRAKKPVEAIDFYPVTVDFGTATQEFHVGMGSIAVPGAIAGLFHVHDRLGRLPLKVLLEPAIHYAKQGIELDEFQAYCFKILGPIWVTSPAMRHVIAPSGSLLQPGEMMVMSELAETLIYLAEAGVRGFYEGEIAHQLVRDCQEHGGYLTAADLQHYQVIERQPLQTSYRGKTLLTNPPPSSGGALIGFALALLSQTPPSQWRAGSTQHLALLADVMQLTNQARKDGYDSHLYKPDVIETFLSEEHIYQYVQLLAADSVNKWGSTTHLSAIDGEGNAASITMSSGEGAAYVIPGTGIMMNNMLGEADLHPGGFHQWQENVRISSMMAPTILLEQHRPAIVLGSGGSNRIRTAIMQVISNLLDFQMPVETAVNSPRVHWEDGVFNLEPGLTAPADRPLNDQEWVYWEAQNMFFGGVHTVLQDEFGNFSAAGDRRRAGAVRMC